MLKISEKDTLRKVPLKIYYMNYQKKLLLLQSQCNTFAVIGSCKFLYDIAGNLKYFVNKSSKISKKNT